MNNDDSAFNQQGGEGEEDDLYDEFGNYIGPELEDSDSSDDESEGSEEYSRQDQRQGQPDDASDVSGEEENEGALVTAGERGSFEQNQITADPLNAIVLHEDKEHYATAEETFGEGVRTAILDEDAMDLDQPIVAPVVTKTHHVVGVGEEEPKQQQQQRQSFAVNYSDEYLTGHLLSNETTATRRGVAIVGHLHHGKTSLIDLLLEPTLQTPYDPTMASSEENCLRYTDILKAERDRHVSLVSTPITMALPDTRGKTYAITAVDCPGHIQFHDESVAVLRLMDGAVLCVDAVEGIMLHTELLVKQIVQEGLPVTLVITKVDRLIVELQLPPKDAYYKLLQIIESVNQLLLKVSMGRYPELSPSRNNVAFSSALHGWLFTLGSFTQLYVEQQAKDGDSLGNLSAGQFIARLWGDWWFDPKTRNFHEDPSDCSQRVERSFVTFCLDPLYKIYTACLGESEERVASTLKILGVHLTKEQLRASARPLLRMVMSRFMQTANCGFVDMIVKYV